MSTDIHTTLKRHTEQLAAVQTVLARIEQHITLLIEMGSRPDGPQAHPDYYEWRDTFVQQVNGLTVDTKTRSALLRAIETDVTPFMDRDRLLPFGEWIQAVRRDPQRALGIRGLGEGRVGRLVEMRQ